MKRILFALSLAVSMTATIPVTAEATTVKTTLTRKSSAKKTSLRNKGARVIGTFMLHGQTFQMLPGGKIKCTTNPNWEGAYEKKSGLTGYSTRSPRVDWYMMELWNKKFDGVEYYLIYDKGKTADIHYLCAGSVEFEITFDPILGRISISAEGDMPEKKGLSDFKIVGTVKGLYRK